MTLNIFGTKFTAKEIVQGAGGTVAVGVASASWISQKQANTAAVNLSKLQARNIIRRDIADGHMTSIQAAEYCKQQDISTKECLNPPIFESKPKQDKKSSSQLRGGGSSMDSPSDSNNYSLQDETNDIQEYSGFLHNETEYVNRSNYSVQDGIKHGVEPVKNDTFKNGTCIGVDPNIPYSSTGNESRLQPYIPFIFSGAFLIGYFSFQWFRKKKTWVKNFFPNETELMIENQIEMQHKLDKISALQEKINEKLLNEKTK